MSHGIDLGTVCGSCHASIPEPEAYPSKCPSCDAEHVMSIPVTFPVEVRVPRFVSMVSSIRDPES